MSYNSKYTGQQVEALLDQVANGNAGGGGGDITTEIDPIFSASPSAKITDEDIEEWNNKQDVISDLESIRNNASKGAQALDAIPTKVSQLENDEGYLTSHQDISGLATKDELQGKVDKVDGKQLSTEDFTTLLKQKLDGLSNYDDTEISQAVSKLRTDLDTLVGGDTTTAIKTFNEVIAFLDGIEDSESLDAIIASIEQQIAGKMDKVTLAAVATSGNYNDLSNKPTIPSAVTESTVSGWGFTKNTGTYSKPSGGIPKTDLASAVQTSLGKADTALQSVPSEYVTETELNNKGYATSSQLNTGFADAERKFAALNEEMDNKQPMLVSGTNIKTINGNSILGSGNIVISGGGSSSGGGGAYAEVSHGTGDTTFALTPNTFHVWDEVASLDLSFGTETIGVANEYLFQFTSGATATTLTLPDGLKWANDAAPTIAENMIYQISVLKGLASVLEFSNAAELIENHATISNGMMECTVTFDYPVASEIKVIVNSLDGNKSVVFSIGETTKTIKLTGPSPASIVGFEPTVDSKYVYIF